MNVKPGDVIADKFSIVTRLGEDKGRSVLLARQIQTKRPVALEIMPQGTSERRMAMRFARAAQINSIHVPTFIDIGSLPDGRPYVATEYFDGMSLGQLQGGKSVAIGEAVDYVLQACDAVAAAHAIGLVHRRLKTSSLFRATSDGGPPCIKVLDFPAVSIHAPEGAPPPGPDYTAYLAPEVFDSGAVVDRRCDIWSLGVILYELLTGTSPFHARTTEKLHKRVCGETPAAPHTLRRDIPKPLEEAILRCLEKSPAARFQTVAELALALAPFGTALTAEICARLAQTAPPGEEDVTLRPPEMKGHADVPFVPLQGPMFDDKPGGTVGFVKKLKDGRMEAIEADQLVGVVRAKRIESEAVALAKAGPKVAPPPQEEEGEIRAIGGPDTSHHGTMHATASTQLVGESAPTSAPEPASAPAPAEVVETGTDARRRTLIGLVIAIAIISGLLVGLIMKIVLHR